ncbi:MAG: TetR family transcriptional regulator [Nocardioidaceae bacterium]|nr:TetR family transcriptional regulator [Nocardioidaceae bacterium]
MTSPVKSRPYRSVLRSKGALATRRAILAAAERLFAAEGYAATTVTAIATEAGVSVDTVYASVGRKPQLILGVIDMTLGSSADAPAAEERQYVVAIRAAPSAQNKLAIYAAAVARLVPQIRPLQEALREAAALDSECATAWRRLVDRRAANMRLFAADLRATGELRPDLTDAQVADIVWATNSVEFFGLLSQRGWGPPEYEALLLDLWRRMLLSEVARNRSAVR